MNKRRISQCIGMMLLIHAGLMEPVFGSAPTDGQAVLLEETRVRAPEMPAFPPDSPYFDPSDPFNDVPDDSGGGFEGNPGDNDAVKDASQGTECGGSNPAHANPIVMSTGNKVEQEVDFTSEGELPLTLVRTYNHYWKYPGLFGKYWVSSLDYSLVIATDESTIYAQRPDGRRIKFKRDPANANNWIEDKANPIANIKRISGNYFFRTENDFLETYNGSGRIKRRTNVNGIAWVFTYDPSGLYLTSVRHSSGRLNGGPPDREMMLTWTNGQLTSVTAPDGSVFKYTYTPDAFGAGVHRLATAISPAALNNGSVVTAYHYENPSFPGGLTGKSFNGVRYSTFAYDAFGRAIVSKHSGELPNTHVEAYTYTYSGTPTTPPAGGPADPPGPGVPCNEVTHNCGALPREPISGASAEQLAQAAKAAAAEEAVISMIPESTTVVVEINPYGLQTTYTYADGKLTNTSNQASAHCQARSNSRSYDLNGYGYQIKDFRGNTTQYNYAQNGQLQSMTEALGTVDARTTSYTWDSFRNRPLTVTVAGLRETTYTYGDINRIVSLTVKNKSPNGSSNDARTWNYQYTRWGTSGTLKQVVASTPLGSDNATMNYSEDGDLLAVSKSINGRTYTTSYSGYDGMGRPATIVGANGERTDYAYYPGGKLKSITTYPNGSTAATTTFRYVNGLLESVAAANGVTTTYTYTNARQLKTASWPIIGGTAKRTYAYDGGGNNTRVDVDLDGVVALTKTTGYDELGRVLTRTGNHGQNFFYTYDVNGNLNTVTDSDYKTTAYTYDALNRLKTVRDANHGVTTFAYDLGDHTISVTDPRNKTTSYSYDGLDQLHLEGSQDSGVTSYLYRSNGLIDSMTRGNNVRSTYTYDAWGRVLSVSAGGKSQGYSYDLCTNGAGRLCGATSPDSSFSFTYEPDGRIRSRTDSIKVANTTSNHVTTYTYDSVGRRATMTYPNNQKVSYGYLNGLPNTMNVTIGGIPKVVVSAASYEPFGPLSKYTHGNLLVRDYVFDNDGRYSAITSKYGSTPLQSLSYQYDSNDRIRKITNNLNPSWTDNFSYDALSRLMTGSGDAYTYDANGNRLTKASVNATYNYSPGNRMQTAENVWRGGPQPEPSVSPAYQTTLLYDGGGNTKSWSIPSALFTAYYDYNPFNRMDRVRVQNGSAISTLGIYGYNAANERTSKQNVDSGHNYSYIYGDGHALLAEREDSANWTNYFWFGGQLVGMSRGGVLYQIDNDHLGRPELITDGNRAVAWQSHNDAFGEHRATSTSGPLAGSFHIGLPGQYFDTESNYWYNMNRYYVAEIGRYLQPDPIGLAGGVNPYAYVGGNPVSGVDPLGTETGWVTLHYELDISKIDACSINASMKFYANLIPFVGIGLDLFVGELSDVPGGLGSTVEGARILSENDAARSGAEFAELQQRGLYNRQQRIYQASARFSSGFARMMKPISRSLGVLSLPINAKNYYDDSMQCGCGR